MTGSRREGGSQITPLSLGVDRINGLLTEFGSLEGIFFLGVGNEFFPLNSGLLL